MLLSELELNERKKCPLNKAPGLRQHTGFNFQVKSEALVVFTAPCASEPGIYSQPMSMFPLTDELQSPVQKVVQGNGTGLGSVHKGNKVLISSHPRHAADHLL